MNIVFRISISILIFCYAGAGLIYGQRTPQNPNQDPIQNPIGSSDVIDTTDSGILPLDTPIAMTYVLINDPDDPYSIMDSFNWSNNNHHPLHFDQSHLGNYGSPTRSLAPSLLLKNGFSAGWDQYDPYYVHVDSFRYYNQAIPVAKIKYSQAGKEDTYLTLDFGRSFAKGLTLSLTYDRINQTGEPSRKQFMHQHQRNTSFGLGVWHDAPSGKYDAFYNFISNTAVGEENGGVDSIELVGDTLFPNPLVPVIILQGVTTHKHRSFITRQILHLISDTSELGIDVWFQGHVAHSLFKYADEGADAIFDYYSPVFLVDQRGLRQFTYLNEYQLTGGIALPWRAARSTIQTSIRYRSVQLQQEPLERRITEMYWDASGRFNWIESLELKGTMSLGLGQASGSFLFHAEGALNTGLLGRLEGHWSILTRRPHMVESQLFVNQQLIYNHDFQNPFSTEVGVGWNWEKQNLKAGIKWIVFDNYIFFNADRMPGQFDQSFSLRRFYASKVFDFKWVGFSGNLIWQPEARAELAIPDLMYKASFYGKIKMFRKRLKVMPGIDLTYHDGYSGVGYFPVTGRFHLTGDHPIPDYFRVDAGIVIHINFLKAFVRIEDLHGFWEDRVLYQAELYPHYPAYFRLGLETSFFN